MPHALLSVPSAHLPCLLMQVVHVKTTPLLLALLERVPEELPVPLDPPPEEPFEAPPEPDAVDDDEDPLLGDPPEEDEVPAEPSSPDDPVLVLPPQPDGVATASKSAGPRVRASFAGCMSFLPRVSLREN
jgi:hypothetical protein